MEENRLTTAQADGIHTGMLSVAIPLPDDIDALKTLVRATAAAYETQVRDLR